MKICTMTASDISAVSQLEAASFSTPWSENSIRSELENPWAIWLVARDDATLAGYIGVQYGPDGGDILTIATDPACRGRGVAKALILHMVQLLREKDLSWLTLEVRPSNHAALSLYESMGFRQVGRRKNYYRSPVEDALLLTLYFKEDGSC
ncbi:MAG: ribosomal protein S18-alanine N-acetyltransferase [Oscillospiraceae bacterium]|nr:ribosomal protein S18-alanine N-acetyltransferase [Oscillospiraceae bacterium]